MSRPTAAPGSVIVVQTDDLDFAVAGGNVCAVAQQRGIAAFIIDGVIRDVAEIRASKFPVFARGLSPIPGGKDKIQPLNQPITCGGVRVEAGDIVVADEEGIVAVPAASADSVLQKAQLRAAKDDALTLDQWEAQHRERIESTLREKGYSD
jgi:regulator of RNase E activity RraA